MIIFKGIEKSHEAICYLIFDNEDGERVSIPIIKKVADLITHHLQAISKNKKVVEHTELEESD